MYSEDSISECPNVPLSSKFGRRNSVFYPHGRSSSQACIDRRGTASIVSAAVDDYVRFLNLKNCTYINLNVKTIDSLSSSLVSKVENVKISIDPEYPMVGEEINLISTSESIWDAKRTEKSISGIPGRAKIIIGDSVLHLIRINIYSQVYDEEIYKLILIYETKDVEIVQNLLAQLDFLYDENERQLKTVQGLGRNLRITSKMTWEDLILDPFVIKRTREDLESWIGAEERYNKMHLPYRRGYLFEGPPGNGKTAVAKVMISNYNFSVHSFDFSDPRVGDYDFYEAFFNAAKNAPSIVLLEDIDRVFLPEGTCSKTNVTMEAFLNCLDGAVDYSGVVVIATANHPEKIDPAVRRRPGRFDVPVRFDNPNFDLRKKYLNFAFARCNITEISSTVIEKAAKQTEGMSMAFMKAIFEKTAGKEKLNDSALLAATEEILTYYRDSEQASDRKAGF